MPLKRLESLCSKRSKFVFRGLPTGPLWGLLVPAILMSGEQKRRWSTN